MNRIDANQKNHESLKSSPRIHSTQLDKLKEESTIMNLSPRRSNYHVLGATPNRGLIKFFKNHKLSKFYHVNNFLASKTF